MNNTITMQKFNTGSGRLMLIGSVLTPIEVGCHIALIKVNGDYVLVTTSDLAELIQAMTEKQLTPRL